MLHPLPGRFRVQLVQGWEGRFLLFFTMLNQLNPMKSCYFLTMLYNSNLGHCFFPFFPLFILFFFGMHQSDRLLFEPWTHLEVDDIYFWKLHLLGFHVEVWPRGFLNEQRIHVHMRKLSLSLFLIYLLINFQPKSKSNLSTPLVLDTYVYVVYTHTYMSMHLESKGSQESFLSARSSTVSCAPVDDTSPWTCATSSVKEYRWLVIQWGFDHHRDFDIHVRCFNS